MDNLGIWYKFTPTSKLTQFIDYDWVRSMDDMKNTSGYAFKLYLGTFPGA